MGKKSSNVGKRSDDKGIRDNKGITADKDELSEWYTQLLQKAELIEYTDVSGAYIIRPRAYFIWERVKEFFDDKIKKDGVRNASFPLFIPKSNLMKEAEHVEGFTPEVAWVTHAGDRKLDEKLAVRPTSETIFYPAYSKWIRSWKDLPVRINQWCNVVRWEFKNPIPFIRSREFLWQEGHSAFSSKDEAAKEVKKIQDFYEETYREMYAIPVIKGMKTDKEKFAGADYTLTVEAFLPSGKAAQGATSHLLGQNFAKAFEIDYLDKNEKKQFVWQTSWGISTRSVGVAIMMHSDDKGLVVSPRVAEKQIVVVPIFGKKDKDARKKVMGKVNEIVSELGDVRVLVDDSDNSPGYKFNEWEMKGVPLRLEFGMRDLDSGKVVLVRRDNGKKEEVKFKNVSNRVAELLEDIHGSLYNKAKKFLRDNTVEVSGMKELVKVIENKKLVVAKWDGSLESEDMIKDKSGGGKILCIRKEVSDGKCVYSGKKAKYEVYVGKSY